MAMLPHKHIKIAIVATTFTVFILFSKSLSELSLKLYWFYTILYVSNQNTLTTRHTIVLLMLCVFAGTIGYVVYLEKDDFFQLDPLKMSIINTMQVVWKRISTGIPLHHCASVRILKKVLILRFIHFVMTCCVVYIFCSRIDVFEILLPYSLFNAPYNVIILNGNFSQSQWGNRINATDNDVTTTERVYHEQEGYMSLYSTQTSRGNITSSLSIESLKFERYIGEGIRLPCSFRYKIPRSERLSVDISNIKTTKGFSIYPFFTKENKDVESSFKQAVNISLEENGDLINYEIHLDIYALEPVDFGVYRGGLKFVFRSDCRCVHKILQITELYMCAFNITQVSEHYQFVDAPVGGLLAFKNLFVRGIPNEEHLHVQHFVNGISLNASSETAFGCCLQSANLFKNGRDLIISKDYILSFELTDVYEISGEICVCSSVYGLHRFKLYRYLFDQKDNVWKTVEFWHPQITVLYPKSSNLIWDTISNNEYDLINKSKRDKDFSLFNGSTFQILQSKLDHDHSIMQYFENCLYMMTVCALIASLIYSWGYSMAFVEWIQDLITEKLGIRVNLRLPEAGGNLANLGNRKEIIDTAGNDHVYDVFVSYVEEDRSFVEEMNSFLEQQNQRVCLSEENLPAGPLITSLEEAVRSSKKVIVIVSNSYTSNTMFNEFLLPTIILPMLYNGCIPSGHLMLLVCQPCKIPEPLLYDKRIVKLDYSINPKHICQKKLQDWLHSSRIHEYFSLQPVLHADILQQEQ